MTRLSSQRRVELWHAQNNYLEAMRKEYPEGSEILFYRNPRQDTPHAGIVHYVESTSIIVRMPDRYKKKYWHIRHEQVV
jgi:hypothetical protein